MKHSTPTSALFAAAALALAASAPLASAADAYLESDGTQFMNTGYYVGPQTKIEFDYAIANWAPTADYYQMRLLDNNASNKGGLQATVYIADSENCPYGNKPAEEIVRLSERNTARLEQIQTDLRQVRSDLSNINTKGVRMQ